MQQLLLCVFVCTYTCIHKHSWSSPTWKRRVHFPAECRRKSWQSQLHSRHLEERVCSYTPGYCRSLGVSQSGEKKVKLEIPWETKVLNLLTCSFCSGFASGISNMAPMVYLMIPSHICPFTSSCFAWNTPAHESVWKWYRNWKRHISAAMTLKSCNLARFCNYAADTEHYQTYSPF